jgi:hypothetical protein
MAARERNHEAGHTGAGLDLTVQVVS